jgi:hypothetical protein
MDPRHLLFLGAKEKCTVQVYETKLMTTIDYQGTSAPQQ